MKRDFPKHWLLHLQFLLPLSWAGTFVSGCSPQTAHMQEVHVRGPNFQPPVHITVDSTEDRWRVRPRVVLNTQRTIAGRFASHTNVNTQGFFQVDTVIENGMVSYVEQVGVNTIPFNGKNISWRRPLYNFSLDVDYTVSSALAISGGFSLSNFGKEVYLGGNVGIGIFFQNSDIAGRIDGGVQWQPLRYEAEYVHVEHREMFRPTKVRFFSRFGRHTHTNFYGAFTLNSKATDWPVNFFVQVAAVNQGMLKIKSQGDLQPFKVLHASTYILVTPGIIIPLSGHSRMLFGFQMTSETTIHKISNDLVLSPLMQFDFDLVPPHEVTVR